MQGGRGATLTLDYCGVKVFLGSVDSVLSQCIWKYSKSWVEKRGENKDKMGMT